MTTTRFVPVIALMPLDDYLYVVEKFVAPRELPADLRSLIASYGWTEEQVMIGRMLSQIVELDRNSSQGGDEHAQPTTDG